MKEKLFFSFFYRLSGTIIFEAVISKRIPVKGQNWDLNDKLNNDMTIFDNVSFTSCPICIIWEVLLAIAHWFLTSWGTYIFIKHAYIFILFVWKFFLFHSQMKLISWLFTSLNNVLIHCCPQPCLHPRQQADDTDIVVVFHHIQHLIYHLRNSFDVNKCMVYNIMDSSDEWFLW